MSSLDRECYVRLAAGVDAAIGAYDDDGPVLHGIGVDEALGTGHPFDVTTWEVGPVEITDEGGAVIFSEPSAEFPESWGAQARTIVAQKYFYGDHGQGFRETSLKQLLLRVTARIALWAMARRTFRTGADARNFYHSLLAIQLRQEFAFNSPIYFNVGIDIYEPMVSRENYMWDDFAGDVVECPDANKHPQVSACFIQSVRDNMMSIMALATSEAMIFKRGSGSGTDLSPLRSCREKLSGGGRPSGPLSFMRIYDAVAAVVKSGGKSRRAAKMQTLKCDHPDIIEFIVAKGDEEKKAQALIREGYEANFNGEAYSSVFFQNSNLSVRVTDEFMRKATGRVGPATYDTIARTTGEVVDTLSAPDVLDRIADRAHSCGDPGLQFEDTIQRWHTVPGHGPINSSNPCAEYMHIDDSACNLASINAMQMMDEDLGVNYHYMRAVIDVMTVAMETVVDEGSYPTPEIALNSHRFRPLGGGYANVGAYVMALGVAYDSDEARSFVAAFTSLLTARMYRRSAELARLFGAFDGFAADRDNMLNVIYKHWEETRKLLTGTWDGLALAALDDWADAHAMGSIHGFRNSQATCIAPTGTIAFMMGCDTLGIEPEIALVRYKHLAGRGVLKLTSRVVRVALESLGYDATDRDNIIDHIRRFGTIQDVVYEGPGGLFVSSGLNVEHMPVFDCAFAPPARGVDPIGARWSLAGEGRYISAAGHVDMMAAATPFVSGAISKTVNMPEHCTADDIRGIYVRAWETGCKAIAVYRDNSKGSQPITTAAPAPVVPDPGSSGGYDALKAEGFTDDEIEYAFDRVGAPMIPRPPGPVRHKLPDTRESVTHKFSVEGHEGYVIVGLYEDKSPGEVFVSMAKNGSTVGGLLDSLGIMISLGLQYGVPLAKIVEKLANQRFEPRGITIDRDIPFATSIVDYIAKWLGCYFIPGYRDSVRPTRGDDTTPAASHGPAAMDTDMVPTSAPFAAEIHGKACPACGSIMVRQGPCYMCFSCGFTDGGCGG